MTVLVQIRYDCLQVWTEISVLQINVYTEQKSVLKRSYVRCISNLEIIRQNIISFGYKGVIHNHQWMGNLCSHNALICIDLTHLQFGGDGVGLFFTHPCCKFHMSVFHPFALIRKPHCQADL